MTLFVIFYPYHFVRAILSMPFCPIPFCPYTILSIPFCPYHFVRYHFVLEPLKSHWKYHTFEGYYICVFSKLRHKAHQKVRKCSPTVLLRSGVVTFYKNCSN